MEAELSSSVIGGLLIGFFALLGIGLTDTAQKQRDERRQLKTTLGVLHAVKEELKEIYSVLGRRDVKKVWEEIKYRRKDLNWFYRVLPNTSRLSDHLSLKRKPYRSDRELIPTR